MAKMHRRRINPFRAQFCFRDTDRGVRIRSYDGGLYEANFNDALENE